MDTFGSLFYHKNSGVPGPILSLPSTFFYLAVLFFTSVSHTDAPSNCLKLAKRGNNYWQNTQYLPPNPFVFTPLPDKNALLTKLTEV